MVVERAVQTAMVELSVIIPTYNRAQQLRACLEALYRQTQPVTDFEVIVVIDGSTDGTREMIARLTVPFDLHVVWQQNSWQGAARNHGADHARGRYCLAWIDIIAAPTLVAEHELHRQREGVVGIGQIKPQLPVGPDWFTRCFARGWKTTMRSCIWVIDFLPGWTAMAATCRYPGRHSWKVAALRSTCRAAMISVCVSAGAPGDSPLSISMRLAVSRSITKDFGFAADAEKSGASWGNCIGGIPPHCRTCWGQSQKQTGAGPCCACCCLRSGSRPVCWPRSGCYCEITLGLTPGMPSFTPTATGVVSGARCRTATRGGASPTAPRSCSITLSAARRSGLADM